MSVSCLGRRPLGAPNGSRREKITTKWSYADDGGATGTFFLTYAAEHDVVIHEIVARVKTALTASGSATLGFGHEDSASAYGASIAVAAFAADTVVGMPLTEGAPNTRPTPARLAAGKKLAMAIGGDPAGLSAGILEIDIVVTRF